MQTWLCSARQLEMLFYMRIPSFCLRGIVPTCKWQRDVARLGLKTRPSNLFTTWSLTSFKQGLATGCQQTPTMCSPLEHSEYILLQTNLLKDKMLGTLCEFGQVCLHILDNDIKVIISPRFFLLVPKITCGRLFNLITSSQAPSYASPKL